MRRVRAGIIGLGVGEQHITGYRSHPQCEVLALCDRSPERLTEVCRRLGVPRAYQRAEDLLADPDLDVVSVASYDQDHHDHVEQAILAGKHVFVEKPLCLHPGEAANLRRRLRASPAVCLSSNLVLRGSPRFRQLREDIQAGRLGELFYVEGDYHYGRLEKITEGWRGRQRFYSVMHGGGIHLIDLLMWLSGRRVQQVCAYGTAVASRGSGFRFNDTVVGILRFEQELIGKVTTNFGCVRPHFHGLTICGTAGTFENGPRHARLYQLRDAGDQGIKITTAYPGVGKGDLIYSLVEAVLGQGPPVVTADEVFDAMSVSFALEAAAREGRPIDVQYH